MNWEKINPVTNPPIPRSCHAATVVGNRMYIYGGVSGPGTDTFCDLHEFNFGPYSSPPAPRFASFIMTFLVDTLEWRPIESTGTLPPAIRCHRLSAVLGKLILTGGQVPGILPDDKIWNALPFVYQLDTSTHSFPYFPPPVS